MLKGIYFRMLAPQICMTFLYCKTLNTVFTYTRKMIGLHTLFTYNAIVEGESNLKIGISSAKVRKGKTRQSSRLTIELRYHSINSKFKIS